MRAQCSVSSATLRGVEAVPVAVEVVVTNGIPGMSIVGMPDTAVQEARERVKAAIVAAGFTMPGDKIVVNLAPGNVRKTGSGFDLPIAMGILAATAQIGMQTVRNRLFVGELSLEGSVRPVTGVLAFGVCAYQSGQTLVTACDVSRIPLEGLTHECLDHMGRLHTEEPFGPCTAPRQTDEERRRASVPDFRDVAGHELAKRALQIAAAGSHGVLMMGPPGSGKTMLASRIPSILPELTQEEMIEAAVVHSVAGEDVEGVLAGARPFRRPHHSATSAGLVGGGNPIRPGEISLAHCGVLFLDELAEFKTAALQCLRQPMESGRVCLTRADGNVVFPAKFMLVAASNPCPCGYFGDGEHECTCTVPQIRTYQARIGGPLIDRIELHLDVRRLDPTGVLRTGTGTSSATLREGVIRAREYARWREARSEVLPEKTPAADSLAGRGPACEPSEGALPVRSRAAGPAELVRACALDEAAQEFLVTMAQAYSMSGRAIVGALGVARTIANIEERERVTTEHIAEALSFRLREGIGGS